MKTLSIILRLTRMMGLAAMACIGAAQAATGTVTYVHNDAAGTPLLATDASGAKAGALVVFEAQDAAEVEAFSAADPYVVNGVYDRIEILRWDKTIG